MNAIELEYKNNKKQLHKEYKQQKRSAKKSYKSKKHELKNVKHTALEEYYKTDEFIAKNNPPKRSVLEEIGNAVSHGIGAIFAITTLILMLLASQSGVQKISAVIYSTGMFLSLLSSCLYHSFKYGSTVKRVFRRFDYISIYLLIGSTFAPILLCYVHNTLSYVFFVIQWLIIFTGITFVSIFGPQKIKALNLTLYFLLGWSALIFLPYMLNDIYFFLFILGGGIIYTLGIIPFVIKKSSAHFIWHIFVLLGAVVQWIGIYLYIF